MIGFAVRMLLRLGLPEIWAKRVGTVLVIFALMAIVAGGVKLWFQRHDAAVVAGHEAKLDARAAPAREAAGDQRAVDSEVNHERERAYHDAIENSGGDGPPDPARLGLNCERLRRARIALPPACGSERGH